ncbi:O-antigen ligase family protein [Altererythrobacter lutimaris]|uniref:O-antigen ligase family protein n=1 Tax=Altererythrobacter lutimaris TaxID=2743979 RepID=A0A850H6D6_9SPHN|nr:O-antigen ligase family protein [Altererythrobacter lutimaris]NVE93339.1 O-antigen ligase family protein [Altererythrobacter lutimaris]
MEQVVSRQPNAVYLNDLKSGQGALIVDALLAALPIFACLFNSKLGPLSVILVFGSVVLTAWLRMEKLPSAIARSWPILLIPIFALASYIWSVQPSATMRYGILFGMTVASGVLMATCLDRRAVLVGVMLAYLAFLMTGLAIGDERRVGYNTNEVAFIGIAPSKNMAGSSSAIAILLSLACMSLAQRIRSFPLLAVSVLLMPVALYSLYKALSAGALIGGGAAIICSMMWITSQRLPRQARASILIAISVMVFAAAISVELWLPILFEFVITGSGKDAGLTGRVELWLKADQLIAQRPFLGQGFAAFWVPGNFDAEAIWRDFGVFNRTGFNFHNTAKELLVSLGWVGFTLFSVIAAVSAGALIWRTMVRPDPTRIFFCAWLVYATLRTYFESIGLGQIYAETILTYAALTLGFAKDDLPLSADEKAEMLAYSKSRSVS